MTEQTAEQEAGETKAAAPRSPTWSMRTTAEILVHRRLLTHLVATLPEAEKGQLHALVAADLERARFLGSEPSDSDLTRKHAMGLLDKIVTGTPTPAADRH